MLSWFKRKSAKPSAPAPGAKQDGPRAPGEIRVAYTNRNRNWEERFNLLDVAARAIEARGHRLARRPDCLVHESSGMVFMPKVQAFKPLDSKGAQTVAIMQSRHPEMFPSGIFEFQHATGKTAEESFANGFDQWVQTDLVALLDSLNTKPSTCTAMEMAFAATDNTPARTRRAIFGPVAHFMKNRPEAGSSSTDDEHPFCPCCLLTRSLEAFAPLMNSDDFHAIRMFAMRDENGEPAADCRVNGMDWDPGKDALKQYVSTWPGTGIEFRKQYVVLHSIPSKDRIGDHLL